MIIFMYKWLKKTNIPRHDGRFLNLPLEWIYFEQKLPLEWIYFRHDGRFLTVT